MADGVFNISSFTRQIVGWMEGEMARERAKGDSGRRGDGAHGEKHGLRNVVTTFQ